MGLCKNEKKRKEKKKENFIGEHIIFGGKGKNDEH